MKKIGTGLINDTYLAEDADGSNALIFQRVNTFVFQNPAEVMENIRKVTDHLKTKGIPSLEFIPFEDGSFLKTDENGTWRKMKYVDSVTYDSSSDISIIEGTAEAFGNFSRELSDFKGSLHETIKDFHNTKKRLDDCLSAAEKDEAGRADEAKELIKLVETNAKEIRDDYDRLFSCAPLRVTHNDTKISNVLFDRDSNKPIMVIDLDTVMYGMSIYDYADGARSVSLERKGKDRLIFNRNKYEAYTNVYTRSAKDMLTEDEKKNLFLATITITKELGMRFLEDYLRGDPYFSISEEKSNYFRAKRFLEFAFTKDIIL